MSARADPLGAGRVQVPVRRAALARPAAGRRSSWSTASIFVVALLVIVSSPGRRRDETALGAPLATGALASVGDAFPRPGLSDPLTIALHVGADRLRLNDARDYILTLPASKKTGVLEIRGGRNIWVIGGYLSVADPGPNIVIADGSSAMDGRVVHLEGLLIDGSSGAESDGIRIQAPKAIVQLVNDRIVDLRGKKSGLHADVIQPFGGVKELRIDGLTGSSHYNDLYLRRENNPLGPPIGKVTIYNANLFGYWNGSSLAPPETLRAISIGTQTTDPTNTTSSVNCQLTSGVILRNVYIQPARKRPGQFLYPHDRMQDAGCPATLSADGRTIGWPALRLVDGSAIVGSPSGGDFVPPGTVGLRYIG